MTAQLRLGFIGLGAMGRPMALNLIKAGCPMVVYARRLYWITLDRKAAWQRFGQPRRAQ